MLSCMFTTSTLRFACNVPTNLIDRYIGRSSEIVEKYCGAGGPVEKALAPYMKFITGTGTAELSV